MAIIWRKEMSVGNTLIDEDHRYLMCLANTVELAVRTPDNREILSLTVDQLIDYTEFHFQREQDIQYKIRFPKLDDHLAEHRRIVVAVKQLRDRLQSRVVATAAPGVGVVNGTASVTEDNAGQPRTGDTEPVGAELQATEDDLGIPEIAALVRSWVLDHILGRDRDMIPYLKHYPANYR